MNKKSIPRFGSEDEEREFWSGHDATEYIDFSRARMAVFPSLRPSKEETTVAVKPIPEGYHTVTPYLVVPRVAELIDFLKQAFGAEEMFRMPRPDGAIAHAEVRIGDSMVMMGEPMGEFQPMPAMIHLYVDDADAMYRRAVDAGATSVREPTDQFYGDRSAGVKDQAGNQWFIATHKEDVAPDELARRAEAAMKQGG
jgi:PhnB protein